MTEVNGKNLTPPAQELLRPEGRKYCDTCKYANLVMAGNVPGMICRRNPPTVVGSAVGVTSAGVQMASQPVWPGVTREDWCGEHEPDPRGARTVLPANDDARQPAQSSVLAAP